MCSVKKPTRAVFEGHQLYRGTRRGPRGPGAQMLFLGGNWVATNCFRGRFLRVKPLVGSALRRDCGIALLELCSAVVRHPGCSRCGHKPNFAFFRPASEKQLRAVSMGPTELTNEFLDGRG